MIREKIIKEYPLTKKIECGLDCYEAKKRRYVVFIDEKINKDNIEAMLEKFKVFSSKQFGIVFRTVIVVGYTEDEFDKKDLIYFNGVDTTVVYYLKNTKNNKIYFNDFRDILGWRKIVRRFNSILEE